MRNTNLCTVLLAAALLAVIFPCEKALGAGTKAQSPASNTKIYQKLKFSKSEILSKGQYVKFTLRGGSAPLDKSHEGFYIAALMVPDGDETDVMMLGFFEQKDSEISSLPIGLDDPVTLKAAVWFVGANDADNIMEKFRENTCKIIEGEEGRSIPVQKCRIKNDSLQALIDDLNHEYRWARPVEISITPSASASCPQFSSHLASCFGRVELIISGNQRIYFKIDKTQVRNEKHINSLVNSFDNGLTQDGRTPTIPEGITSAHEDALSDLLLLQDFWRKTEPANKRLQGRAWVDVNRWLKELAPALDVEDRRSSFRTVKEDDFRKTVCMRVLEFDRRLTRISVQDSISPQIRNRCRELIASPILSQASEAESTAPPLEVDINDGRQPVFSFNKNWAHFITYPRADANGLLNRMISLQLKPYEISDISRDGNRYNLHKLQSISDGVRSMAKLFALESQITPDSTNVLDPDIKIIWKAEADSLIATATINAPSVQRLDATDCNNINARAGIACDLAQSVRISISFSQSKTSVTQDIIYRAIASFQYRQFVDASLGNDIMNVTEELYKSSGNFPHVRSVINTALRRIQIAFLRAMILHLIGDLNALNTKCFKEKNEFKTLIEEVIRRETDLRDGLAVERFFFDSPPDSMFDELNTLILKSLGPYNECKANPPPPLPAPAPAPAPALAPAPSPH